MSSLLIKGGTVVFADKVEKDDILIEKGKIKEISKNIDADIKTIPAQNLHIFPGLIDMHAHFREPGFEYKEDIESGLKAAVAGGFTQVAVMPNTLPVCDNCAVASFIKARASEVNLAKLHPIGAVSVMQKGGGLAEIGKMKSAGIVAISDDGLPVTDSALMRHAMEYADGFNLKVLSHCEDKFLSSGGQINEGYVSTVTGLKGINRAAEEIMVAREIILSESLKIPVHICHVSTKGSVSLVREAKRRGVRVTCETCPHYFSLNDQALLSISTYYKVNPPIREEFDRLAIIEGLFDGTIDAIATDHAPHHEDEKHCEFELAAFGISGLETAFSLVITHLYKNGLPLERISKLLSYNPAKILGIDGGEIKLNAAADLTIANLTEKYTVDRHKFFSKGKNTPFDKAELFGKVKCTVVDGEIKFGESND